MGKSVNRSELVKLDNDTIHRAYSTFELKESDSEEGVIEGYASTPTPDNIGDIMEPTGASFKTPMPLLWQHKSDRPIGWVQHARVGDNGIAIRAKILRIKEPGLLKDRLDEAWQSIKYGLVRGLSIGFKGLEGKPARNEKGEPTGGMHFTRWKWIELSSVTMPMNEEATILGVKSADRPHLIESLKSLRILVPADRERIAIHKTVVRLK